MEINIPFQFKVLHYIHDSFTGEFLNIGLALYSRSSPFFKVRLLHKYARITNTFPGADGESYHRTINVLQTKFDRLAENVNSKQLPLEPWLPELIDDLLNKILPPDDSAIQFAPAQGGMAADLDIVFNDLFSRLVEKYVDVEDRLSRTEPDIWALFSKPLRTQSVIGLLCHTIIHTEKDDIEFDHAWKKGRWKALQPLSFDLQHASTIQKKARLWLGTNMILNESSEVDSVYYLLGKPRRDDINLQKAYLKARDLIGTGEYTKKFFIIEEDAAEDFANHIIPQIKADVKHSDGM